MITDELLATLLLEAYKQSLQHKCKMRYITQGGNIVPGAELIHGRHLKETLILAIHAIHE